MNDYCIVVTGLPGSGKTTIGRYVAKMLGAALLDKDDYLETLFDERGVGDEDWRRRLSRESDLLFQEDALSTEQVVLVSHWRPKGFPTQSGTSIEWLPGAFSCVVELYCKCPLGEAARRFMNRERHSGHVDKSKTFVQVIEWMREYERHLPMRLGKQVSVSTANDGCLETLVGQLRAATCKDE